MHFLNIHGYTSSVCVAIGLCLCPALHAWENIRTHPEITRTAVDESQVNDYLKKQMGLSEGVSFKLQWDFPDDIKKRIKRSGGDQDHTNRTVSEWTQTGSIIEDEDGRYWPIRSRHHFHDPCRNSGLDNQTDHSNWRDYACTKTGFDLTGESALRWAVDGIAQKEPTVNYQYWGQVREDFYDALTLCETSQRDTSMAMTLLDLGCVAHLVEDMGVPAHARNDFIEAHYRGIKSPVNFKGNPLESHVEAEVKKSGGIPTRWLTGWTPQAKVFDAVSKYWDTGLYDGNHVGTSPDPTWGLSEQTNYQFLSKSTIFRNNDGTKYYFPHPDLSYVGEHIDSSWWYKRRYVTGYDITHLARKKFTETYASEAGSPTFQIVRKTVYTTFDDAVYEDYAAVTIPRTIDYTAGLLNYFFRGKLAIEPNGLDSETVTFGIRNISDNSGVEQTLKGGTFEVFWDTREGDRTKIDDFTIPGWTTSSELHYDQQVTGTFSNPGGDDVEKYTVVYRGLISYVAGAYEYEHDHDYNWYPGYPYSDIAIVFNIKGENQAAIGGASAILKGAYPDYQWFFNRLYELMSDGTNFRSAYEELRDLVRSDEVFSEHRVRGLGLSALSNIRITKEP